MKIRFERILEHEYWLEAPHPEGCPICGYRFCAVYEEKLAHRGKAPVG